MILNKKRKLPADIFNEVFQTGQTEANKNFKVVYKKNDLQYCRYGVVASTKNFKLAVDRNKIKRKMRVVLHEICTTSMESKGWDIIVMAKRNCISLDFSEYRKGIKSLLKFVNL